jgi:hypothetical protein
VSRPTGHPLSGRQSHPDLRVPSRPSCPVPPFVSRPDAFGFAGDLCSPFVKKDPHHQQGFFLIGSTGDLPHRPRRVQSRPVSRPQSVPSRSFTLARYSGRGRGEGRSSSQRVPSQRVPSRSVPSRSVPSRSVPSRSVPSRSVPSRSVPSRSLPSRAQLRWQESPPFRSGVKKLLIPRRAILPGILSPCRKKDPHHRRGSNFRPRRGSYPHRKESDRPRQRRHCIAKLSHPMSRRKSIGREPEF